MVRTPCCEKTGVKKGPWTAEEDRLLISYIQQHGHGNWRALPKQAGLLRCGKSCRLRWTNYLRPDIKRGNFSEEEEDAIIRLHELLGNRWSAIAARLPGRTDNEIKNVWHTHLKKKMKAQPKSIAANDVEEAAKKALFRSQRPAKQERSPATGSSSSGAASVTAEKHGESSEDCLNMAEFLAEIAPARAAGISSESGEDMDFWLRVLREADDFPDCRAADIAITLFHGEEGAN